MFEELYTMDPEDWTKEIRETITAHAVKIYKEFIQNYKDKTAVNVTALGNFLLMMDDIYRTGKVTPLSDAEYDQLHEIYIELTGNMIHKDKHEEHSMERMKLEHDYPMLKGSMEKVHYITKEERLNDPNAIATHRSIMEWFEDRMEKIRGMKRDPKEEIIISFYPKYDGVSIQLSLDERGHVIKAVTRGDKDLGIGSDRTPLFQDVNLIHLVPKALKGQELGMKIECIMRKDKFPEYNEKFGDGKLINERSAITSLTNSVSFTDIHAQYMSICALMLQSGDQLIPYHSKCGEGMFACPPYEFEDFYVKAGDFTAEHLPVYIKRAKKFIDELPYECDGLVIRFTQQDIIDHLGRNESKGTNNFEVAYKFPKPSNYTTVLDVKQDIGLMGKVSFTAKVEPFEFNNKTIKSVSLGSYDRFNELKLAKGDMVNVKYEIIPYLLVDEHCEQHRSGNPRIEPITNCPYCGEPLVFNPEYMCGNTSCPSRMIGKIYNYCEKMNMENIGEATIEALYHAGIVKNIQDLYMLHTKRDEVINLDGFGETSFVNMVESINNASGTIDRVIGSIGIPSIGRKIFNKVLSIYHIHELLDISPGNESILCTIPGIKETTAKKIIDGIEENRDLIEFLLDHVKITKSKDVSLKVVFTGFRNKLFEEYLSSIGIEVANSVTGDVGLVIADNPTGNSGKIKKAHDHNIPVISVFEAYERFGFDSK